MTLLGTLFSQFTACYLANFNSNKAQRENEKVDITQLNSQQWK